MRSPYSKEISFVPRGDEFHRQIHAGDGGIRLVVEPGNRPPRVFPQASNNHGVQEVSVDSRSGGLVHALGAAGQT